MTQGIERAKKHSEAKLEELRKRLSDIVPQDEVVLTCGSYARREASAESDLDFFIITPHSTSLQDPEKPKWVQPVEEAIKGIVPIAPSDGGAFSEG